MFRRILCVALCLLAFSGCNEDYGTVVTNGGEGIKKPVTQEQNDGDVQNNDIGMNDVGKDYKLFDNKAVVDAYLSGDDSGLTSLEKEIYDEAKKVLDEIKKTATCDYEIELAVHDYIVSSATYDSQAISAVEKPQENSENPYGILVNKTGICLGYTTTFQLFMDMAEIPCVTIYAEDRSYREHAWNQVRIDGEWYYVDCTWDDPVPDYEGRGAFHQYFNVTEEYMWDTGHRWDKDMCEKSDSYESGYILKNCKSASSRDEVKSALEEAVAEGSVDAYISVGDYDDAPDMITASGKVFCVYDEIKIDGDKYLYYVAY